MTQKSVKWLVRFPENEKITRLGRPSLESACYGNDRIASLLNYFVFEASVEAERQNLPEGCNVVVLTRKHDEMLSKFNVSKKTLIRYLDLLNEWGYVGSKIYQREYIVNLEAIQKAIQTPPTPPSRPQYTRKKRCRSTTLQHSEDLGDESQEIIADLEEKVVKLQLNVVDLQQKVVTLQQKVVEMSTLQRRLEALESRLSEGNFEAPILVDYIDCNRLEEGGAVSSSAANAAPAVPLSSENKKVVTPQEKPAKKKTNLLPDNQQRFWSLWLQVDQNKKVAPPLNDTAKDHIKALADAIETQEQLDSLTTFTRTSLREKARKPSLWKVELGNLRSCFDEWERSQKKPASTPAAPEKKRPAPDELVYWSHRYREIRNSDYTNFFWMFEEIRYGDLEPHNQQLYLEEGPIPTTRRQKMSLWESLWKEGKRLPPNIKPPERVAS